MEIHVDQRLEIGAVPARTVWLDIETKKVDAPEGWGYRQRWSVFMVGAIWSAGIHGLRMMVVSGSESEMVRFVSVFEGREIRYAATRDFDEMVMRGRFTNARRAHSDRPGSWPNLDGSRIEWKNVRKELLEVPWDRAADVPSKDVPDVWERGGEIGRDLVALHCGRDVVDLFLRDPLVQSALETNAAVPLIRYVVGWEK